MSRDEDIRTDDGAYIEDVARTAPLDDDGRLHVCIGVNGEGREWFWIVDSDGDGSGCAGEQCFPAHEETGRLPVVYRRRLGLVCGAATKGGGSCKVPVDHRGQRCRVHERETV